MKQLLKPLLIIMMFLACIQSHGQHAKFRRIQHIIDEATNKNLVGVSVYIKSPKLGEWVGVAGYSDVENGIKLKEEDVFGLASISKVYTATAVFSLIEEGKLNLDDKIAQYLPSEIIDHVKYADSVTVRHLLGHTSGFYNYNQDPELNRLYLEGHLKLDTVSHLEILQQYFYGKEPTNKPGERFKYSSTNYLLLSMIMDTALGYSHVDYIRSMLKEHNFTQTWYKETPPQLIKHYGDLNQDGISEDLTAQTIETTNWYSGDDGIYAPISEAGLFLENLVKGEILNESSLNEMMTWNDKKPDFGLGLSADKAFPYKFLVGHSGSGIGMRTDLYYVPHKDMTIAIFSNSGLRSASKSFAETYYAMRKRIILKLFLL
ncbi:MAG: beta-lactamase family protein [Chitinophagales bacterium]|nr:beta-lactamase family protein [Chitinophagales bacterium]